MTKKHFIRAAEITKSHVDSADFESQRYARYIAGAYLQLFSEYNPRFDTQRFLVACGLAEAPVKASKRKAKV